MTELAVNNFWVSDRRTVETGDEEAEIKQRRWARGRLKKTLNKSKKLQGSVWPPIVVEFDILWTTKLFVSCILEQGEHFKLIP